MSKGVKKWYGELSSKLQKAVITAIVTVILGGTSGTGYIVFAKASVVDAHLAFHEKEADKKRRWVLEEQMLEYREMFNDDLRKATPKQKKRYRKWELELDDLYRKLEVRG